MFTIFTENKGCPKTIENAYHTTVGRSCFYFWNFIKPLSWQDANKFCYKQNLSLINYVSLSQNKILFIVANNPFSPLILPISNN